MSDPEICQRNKFGFCKYNLQCKLRHQNDICDSENCKVSQCEKRHPKECFWFKIWVDVSFINALTNMLGKNIKK